MLNIRLIWLHIAAALGQMGLQIDARRAKARLTGKDDRGRVWPASAHFYKGLRRWLTLGSLPVDPNFIYLRNKGMTSSARTNIVALNTVRQGKVRRAVATRAVDMKPENRTAADWASLMLDVAERRDKDAFQSLFDYYAPRVKSFTMRSGIKDTIAEEVAQETLLTVWRKAEKYNPALASPSTWIFTIARNKKIDRLRKDARPLPDANDPTFAGPDAQTPEMSAWHSINAEKIHSALSQLPEEQRKVLTLAFIEENPHAAVSEMLGIPLGTVKSRIRLGLGKLRTLLADQRGDFS